MLQRVFFGPLNSKWEGLGDATRREVFYTATLVAVIVLVGVYPNVVAEMIGQSTGAMFERVQASAAALAALPSSW
jgi:NADH-quinone oxidoreductase subunit M